MRDSLIKLLESAVNKAVNFIHETSRKNELGQPIAFTIRRDLNETLESFYYLSSYNIIQPHDDVIIRSVFRSGETVIFEKLLHFGNYYYSKQKLIHSDLDEKEEILRRTNVESASMLSRVRAFELAIDDIGGSTDDYFISRMPQLLDGISYVLDKRITEIFIPVIYNLFNLHKTIYFYCQSGHKNYILTIEPLKKRVVNLITTFSQLNEFKEILESNYPLRLFYDQYLYFDANLTKKTYGGFSQKSVNTLSLRIPQKLRLLTNLSVLDRDLFIKYFEETFEEIDQYKNANTVETALIVRSISFYLSLNKKSELIDLNIKSGVEDVDIAKYLENIFNRLGEIRDIEISNEELNLLYGYNDSLLREKTGNLLLNVPRNEIEREVRKPHGVFEISDMEIRVKIDGKIIYLCMPFKTGKEIKSNSVSVDVMYQLLRPFFHFNHCAVVFITAKKCSQNLLNEIKRAHDKYGFSIEVIENLQLAKLLKLNGLLN